MPSLCIQHTSRGVLPISSAQHANFTRPTRSQGHILPPLHETSPGWDQKGAACQSGVRLPVMASILERSQHTPRRSFYGQRLVRFFRLGDSSSAFCPATILAWGDVAVDDTSNPSWVKIHLKNSKCDQFGKGFDILLEHTDIPLCPVATMVSYMVERGSSPGPFFMDKIGEALCQVNQRRA